MATSRYIKTNFWRDNYVIDLDPSEKLLFIYLLTNANTSIAGIYEINFRQIAFETGYDKDMIIKMIGRFVADGKVWYQDGWIVLKNWIRHQRVNPSVMAGIERELGGLPAWLRDIVSVHFDDGRTTILTEVREQSDDSLSTDSPQSDLPYSTLLNSTLPNSTLDQDRAAAGAAALTTTKPEKPRPDRVPTEVITAMLQYWESEIGMSIDTVGNRQACAALIRQHQVEGLQKLIRGVRASLDDRYAPRISNLVALKRKQHDLIIWGRKRGSSSNVEVIS